MVSVGLRARVPTYKGLYVQGAVRASGCTVPGAVRAVGRGGARLLVCVDHVELLGRRRAERAVHPPHGEHRTDRQDLAHPRRQAEAVVGVLDHAAVAVAVVVALVGRQLGARRRRQPAHQGLHQCLGLVRRRGRGGGGGGTLGLHRRVVLQRDLGGHSRCQRRGGVEAAWRGEAQHGVSRLEVEVGVRRHLVHRGHLGGDRWVTLPPAPESPFPQTGDAWWRGQRRGSRRDSRKAAGAAAAGQERRRRQWRGSWRVGARAPRACFPRAT